MLRLSGAVLCGGKFLTCRDIIGKLETCRHTQEHVAVDRSGSLWRQVFNLPRYNRQVGNLPPHSLASSGFLVVAPRSDESSAFPRGAWERGVAGWVFNLLTAWTAPQQMSVRYG